MREKGREERGPKAHSKNSDFSTPLIEVLFSGLPKRDWSSSIRATTQHPTPPVHA